MYEPNGVQDAFEGVRREEGLNQDEVQQVDCFATINQKSDKSGGK